MNTAIIFIIFIILILLLLTYIYWFTDLGKNVTLDKYVLALTAFGTLVVIFSIYMTYKSAQDNAERQLELQIVQADESSIIDTEKFFMDNYPYLTNFYKELYSNDPTIQKLNVKIDDPTKETMAESHATEILLTKIETSFYTLGGPEEDWVNSEKLKPWINLWSTWFKSPTLRKYWNNYKQFQDTEVQKFIDGTIIPLANSRSSSPYYS